MDQSEINRFKRGFNHGYIISAAEIQMPKFEKSTKQSANPYIDGFHEGVIEFEKEILIQSRLSELQKDDVATSRTRLDKGKEDSLER